MFINSHSYSGDKIGRILIESSYFVLYTFVYRLKGIYILFRHIFCIQIILNIQLFKISVQPVLCVKYLHLIQHPIKTSGRIAVTIYIYIDHTWFSWCPLLCICSKHKHLLRFYSLTFSRSASRSRTAF